MANLRITWVKSGIGYAETQKKTLKSLGFRRLNQSVTHKDCAPIRRLEFLARGGHTLAPGGLLSLFLTLSAGVFDPAGEEAAGDPSRLCLRRPRTYELGAFRCGRLQRG